jgi:membrane-bound lytic murein transglycosylase B
LTDLLFLPFIRSAVALASALALAACVGPTQAASNAKQRPPSHAEANEQAVYYATRPDAMAFAVDLAMRRDLDVDWVRQQIGQAQSLPQVTRLMQPAPRGTPKNWAAYRARFIEPVRLRAGLAFWQANRDVLARAR